ncbi:MAG: hypothetical protein GY737_01175 [Desulfobacteraceae bacterium]|nr:hypothetical protein [Desulfobacteraceae bacterium]
MSGELKARWGQPLTGIISFIVFFLIAWITWFIFSDPRGPVGSFPYPFVMYLAMMILVGIWQHMFCGDWPFQDIPQPARGIILTIVNLILVWLVIHLFFYRILGLGFNFLSQSNLNELVYAGTLKDVVLTKHFAQSAVVCFVLIGFYSYPFVTILFGKWPVRPSDLPQPQAGLAEIGWCSMLTLVFYSVLIVPFWGLVFGKSIGSSFGLNFPWWDGISGISHVHWVFGWWEWMIIILFLTPNIWRMKPWTLIPLPQPWKGLISFVINVILGYAIAFICVKIAPVWLGDMLHHIDKHPERIRFLWYHAAEIAGFTLIPFLIWHHYFDDLVPFSDVDSWRAFWFRTGGVLFFCIINYIFYYYSNFGSWALGNPHWDHRFLHGESLVWNFWWIIPLLWNEWFFHKWPFYVPQKK